MIRRVFDGHYVNVEWDENDGVYKLYDGGECKRVYCLVGESDTIEGIKKLWKDYIQEYNGQKPKLRVKIDEGGLEPVRAHETDAGLDLRSPITTWIHPGENVKIDTKVRMAIPEGLVGLVTSKSGLMLKNITSRGTIDAHYRGTIGAVLYNHGKEGYLVHEGDKVCQLVIVPVVIPEIEYVDELDVTDRNEGGFGSTGK